MYKFLILVSSFVVTLNARAVDLSGKLNALDVEGKSIVEVRTKQQGAQPQQAKEDCEVQLKQLIAGLNQTNKLITNVAQCKSVNSDDTIYAGHVVFY